MKPEQQRIAIAEACGHMNVRFTEFGSCVASTALNKDGGFWGRHGVPDYLNDLNAMHEAEKTLTPEQRNQYINILDDMAGDIDDPVQHDFQWCCSSANHRAKAFVRVVGKWEEEKSA